MYSVFCDNLYEKESKKKIICITESLCCIPETNINIS